MHTWKFHEEASHWENLPLGGDDESKQRTMPINDDMWRSGDVAMETEQSSKSKGHDG